MYPSLLVLASLLAGSSAQGILYLGVGEVCKDGPEQWYCRRHQDCPGVRDAIKNGWAPSICSFENRQPVICCPPNAVASQTTPPTTTTVLYWWQKPAVQQTTSTAATQTSPSNTWNNWNSGTTSPNKEKPVIWGGNQVANTPDTTISTPVQSSKAEQMCKEYGKYVYMKVKPPVLLLGAEEKEQAFCGRIAKPLIVKGENAGPREFPHMARIGYGNKPKIAWLCGGSLISERYILSAAHCTKPAGLSVARWANLGDLDTSTSTDEAQPVTLRIVETINHPDYKTYYHDISLYKLEKDAPLGIYIRPICLNTQNSILDTTAIASGWGHTIFKQRGNGSSWLQKVDIKFVSASKCNDAYKGDKAQLPQGIRSDYMLCAGGHDGKDTCQGDSGGPLQIPRREPFCTYSIVGVTSFGKGCGSNTPGVYTNVAHYVPWIESIVWPS